MPLLNRNLLAIACAVTSATTAVWACEDEHPLVAVTPVEELVLHDVAQRDVVSLAFDPRGIRAVVPPGDDPNRWINADDSAGAWHYREWQWWKGHPWGDSCRPRYWTTAELRLRDEPPALTISYRIDGFDCRQTFLLPTTVEPNSPQWDLVTTVRNVSNADVEEYGQFFACYAPLNRGRSFWYWDESDQLVRFADRGVSHLDGYVAHPRAYFFEEGAIPHCPRGGGKIVGKWRHPVMVSHASPAGWRSVILLEADRTASLAQGIEGGAMDYILFPGPDQRTFPHGAEFSAHIRHVMLKSPELPTPRQLEALWNDFQESHASVHERTARL